jgi:GT2 family glycosyltransferase
VSVRPDPLRRICLAISSFNNDREVLELLDGLEGSLQRFASILVVDSLGTGMFVNELERRGLTDLVRYHCVPENLGSAGNLARRLHLASREAADFVYAVNHDGRVSANAIEQLVQLAETSPNPLGALYPLRRMVQRGGAFDVTGRYRFPLTAIRSKRPPREAIAPVYWSSSNGALYALAPVRAGLLPDATLWMGFEDLAYGWLLESAGYRQFVARDVQVEDPYEYRRTPVGYVTRKPSWYAYYYARNLILAARRTRQPPAVRGLAVTRVVFELGVTLVLRRDKKARLLATTQGLLDALRNRSGKWRLP